ncbi:MAG: phospholipid carrier-dependent glycosyltransferase [Candidatus Aceula meridiana]|nr:phospholipid carrier-dependent glycosyltransferase [Candidatus Aceula meridiana]
MSHRKLILILLGISFFTLMLGNGAISLTHPDEVFYVQTAKEMMLTNSWATPYIFDAPQFEKPIFTYWLLILAMKLFGMTAFGARFIPALFGILGVLITYWMAWLLFRDKKTAFFSGVVLSTSFIWLALSRAVLTDMVFSVWIVLALALFYWAYSVPSRKSVGLILCLSSCAIAVLTKGILGFIFPFGTIVFFLLYKRDIKFLFCRATFFGFLAFLVISVPWHVVMIKLYGKVFIEEYWYNVHVRRIFVAEHQKSNTWYFYFMTMAAGIFPWTFFVIPAGSAISRNLRSKVSERGIFVFLGIWIALVWFLMQVAQSKLASYIFPVFPAIAICLGFYFAQLLKEPKTFGKLTSFFGYPFSAVLIIGGLAAMFFARRYQDILKSTTSADVFAVLIFICGLVFLWAMIHRKIVKIFVVTALIPVCLLVALIFGYNYAEPWVSCKKICDVFKTIDNSSNPILSSKFYARGVRYYTDRPVAVIDINGKGYFSPHYSIPFLSSPGAVIDFLNERPYTYCIVKKNQKEDLEWITKGKFRIIFFKEIGGKYILRIEKI